MAGLILVRLIENVCQGAVKMAGPKHVEWSRPREILARCHPLGASSLSGSGAVVSQETEVISPPPNYCKAVIAEVIQVEHPRCPLPDIEPDDILAILMIARDRE